MKAPVALLLLNLAALAAPLAGKTWIVDSNTGRPADYRTLGEAHSSAEVTSGDTLYLMPSSASYGDVNLTKRLAIIGPGYLMNQNLDFPVAAPSATVGNVAFTGGSDGGLIMGLDIQGSVQLNGANNLTIKRNLVHGRIWCTQWVPCHNVQILQNHVRNDIFFTQGAANSGINIRGNYVGAGIETREGSDTVNVQYNTVQGMLLIGKDSYAANNLISGELFIYDISRAEHNWRTGLGPGSNSAEGEMSGNPWTAEVAFADQFAGAGSIDARWQLKPGAAVRGTGKDGTDPGAFGGPEPYVLSGLPTLPQVTGIAAPASASAASGLPVTVTVELNP